MTRSAFLTFSLFVLLLSVGAGAQEITQPPPPQGKVDLPGVMDNLQEEVLASLIRLPLAALLGTALALRPRRGATAPRQPTVVQTQIILAVVGSLIMLVVGSSLARAFGIVGAANLIRYRSKIDDPKDAVVMLCALSVGLASGVGLYGLAAIGTAFLVLSLWILEGFEPQTRVFELSLKLGDATQDLKPKIEQILRRYKVRYELRASSAEEVGYQVTTPRKLQTDKVSNEIMALVPEGKGAIVWDEKSKDKVPK
ncbi:MAG: MgtC/SapB family protein [Acidobacteriota bacterium]|nr:MgtC/SapB family protein [Acidobacteriota bacterium]